jgi:hypothetical protein
MKKFMTVAAFLFLAVAVTGAFAEGGQQGAQGTQGAQGAQTAANIYKIGDHGPGGGIVFYDKGENTDGWRYLEAAREDMPTALAYMSSGYSSVGIAGTGTGIGTGSRNTALILAVDANAPAAKACRDYRGPNNLTDWFLPSRDELNELYKQRGLVLFLGTGQYWSSSQSGNATASYQVFNNDGQSFSSSKNNSYSVRAVRAFSAGAVARVQTPTKTYNIGDRGPGGGIVFYDKGQYTYEWRYLEAAPDDIPTTLAWASSGHTSTDIPGTGTVIGTGSRNTALILAVDPNAPAAKACRDYRGPNNLTDWFLPSKDELNELYKQKATVRYMGDDRYWSSSQESGGGVPSQQFSNGRSNSLSGKSSRNSVRAIRAF